MAELHILQYLHPFYVASDLPDLDAAFEDGKARAINTLDRKIAQIRQATRADYEREFCRPQHKAEARPTPEGAE